MNNKIRIILILFLSRFPLTSTSKPSPALDNNPAIAAPKLIVPFNNNTVIANDIAQLGIKPIIAVTIGWINLYKIKLF